MFDRLKARLFEIRSLIRHGRIMRQAAVDRESGSFEGPTADRARSFDADYRAATLMLRARMNRTFPDAYHARLSAVENQSYPYGEQRAAAVDIMSTAIAMALRDGASVAQAAEAGAASVGI